MSKDRKKKNTSILEADFIEFVPADEAVSSAAFVRPDVETTETEPVQTLDPATTLDDMPPVFRELALPKLPELAKENRARLLMQSPNRLFFYWSIATNPYQHLNKALGSQTAAYTLVLKLVNLKRETEDIRPIDSEGSSWFDVEADSEYRAEVGFYAPNRPYVRALFSNTVETPRKTPSPRVDTEADWAVSASGFARALEAAGFEQDAFDVAISGDDPVAADVATHTALSELLGTSDVDLSGIAADEIRFAMLSLASKAPLDSLRWKIGPELFALLQNHAASLNAETSLDVLKQQFDIDAEELTEKEFGPAVYGSSSINFPKRLWTKRTTVKFEPISSGSRPVPTSGGLLKN